MHTLGRGVEFTMTLVRALHRVVSLDPASPTSAGEQAPAQELTRLIDAARNRVCESDRRRGGWPPEVHVDGTGPMRTELRRLVGRRGWRFVRSCGVHAAAFAGDPRPDPRVDRRGMEHIS